MKDRTPLADVQRVAGEAPAVREDHAVAGAFDTGGDCHRTVAAFERGELVEAGHRRNVSGAEAIAVPSRSNHVARAGAAVVERKYVVGGRFAIPRRNQRRQSLRLLAGEIAAFGEIGVDVVQLPRVLRVGPARGVPRHGFPTVRPNRAVTVDFKVLGLATGRRRRAFARPGVGKRETCDRNLPAAAQLGGCAYSRGLQHSGQHVDRVVELRPQPAGFRDARRPVRDQGHAYAAFVRCSLGVAQRRVAGLRPADRISGISERSAEEIDAVRSSREFSEFVRREQAHLVPDALGPAFRAGSIVG